MCRGRGRPDRTVTHRIPRDIKGYQDREGSALGATAPQKKITSSLLTSSVVASGVVGSEGAGEAGGRDVPPNLKASGGVVAGAGLGAGSGRELGDGYRSVRSHHRQWLGSQWSVAGLTWGRCRPMGSRQDRTQ